MGKYVNGLVSVVVPIYNCEKYIKRCLESIFSQSYPNIEIIVVDDATPDNSMEIVSELQKSHPMLCISHDINKGQMWARYTGYMAAKGEYLTFVDSDDTLPNRAIELMMNQARTTGADIVSGNIDYVQLDGNVIKWKSSLKYGNDSQGLLSALVKNEYRHNLVAKLFKTSLLKDHDYITFPNSRRYEDYCLFYQMANNIKNAVCIDDSVYSYFQTPGSSSQADFSPSAIESVFMTHKLILDLYSKDSIMSELYSQNQILISKMIFSGLNRNGIIDEMIRKYEMQDVISWKNIFKCNNLLTTAKVICAMIVGRAKS